MEDNKVEIINSLIKESHEIAVSKGWWEEPIKTDGECILLMHTELSEACEALRKGNPPDEHCPKFDNMTIELADCIIRIFDFAGQKNLPLAEGLLAKMDFNKSRAFRHGGKKL